MPLLKTCVKILCLAVTVGPTGVAVASGSAERGKLIAYTCLGCHGIENYKNVYPTYSVPELAGQRPEYIVAALKAYKSQERSHATMHAQAASLSEQDMEDVAEYLAGPALKTTGAVTGTPPAKVTQLCVACHGKDGVSATGDYPTLAGQHADYLLRALQEYKLGDRKNAVMPGFVSTLGAEDMQQIAAYYSMQTPSLQTVARRETLFSAN